MKSMMMGVLMAGLLAPAMQAEIVVTPRGGIQAFEAARDRVRRQGRAETILLRRGDYFVDHTVELDNRDPAGTVVRAEEGVRWIGGVRVRDWRKVSDNSVLARLGSGAKGQVVYAGLDGLGGFEPRGFGRKHSPAHSELFFNGKRMTVARWPNEGFTKIAEPADAEPQDDEHGRTIGRLPFGFRYGDERPSKWKPDRNIWVHGYWAWDWADSYERIERLDPATRTIVTAAPHGLYGFRKDQRYYFLNVLEELDAPGEYYLDAEAGRIYFWPPADLRNAEVFVSRLSGPMIVVKGARGLTVEGLELEASRGDGVLVEGGGAITLRNLKVRNTGNVGIVVDGGTGHTVAGCDISYTGDSAIEVSGGDRATLSAAGHRVEDCDIHHMGEWVRTYNPAVKVSGVGITVAHNAIHHAPHAGILMTGNEHVIEYNNIHHLAQETGDVGAIYLGRDFTERGTVIRYNYIHELGGVGLGSMAVYLDDCASGTTVFGNIFYKLKYGAFIGGGRDNRVENNVFVDCNPAVHVDARGIDKRPVWQNMVYRTMKPRVEAMRVTEAPYAQKYPQIRTVLPYLEKSGGVPPEGNIIHGNLIQGTGLAIREPARPFVTDVADNESLTDPSFFDASTGRFRLPAGKEFEPIPVEQIGPRRKK
jgi:hypothetical protein